MLPIIWKAARLVEVDAVDGCFQSGPVGRLSYIRAATTAGAYQANKNLTAHLPSSLTSHPAGQRLLRALSCRLPGVGLRLLLAGTGSPSGPPLADPGWPHPSTEGQLTVPPGKTRSRPSADSGDRQLPGFSAGHALAPGDKEVGNWGALAAGGSLGDRDAQRARHPGPEPVKVFPGST